MGKKALSLNHKLYYNAGTYASPTWNELEKVGDIKINLAKTEADVTTRESAGWEDSQSVLKQASADVDLRPDKDMPADADYVFLRDAWINDAAVELAFSTGDIAVAGHQLLRVTFDVMSFPIEESLKDVIKVPVSFKKCPSDNVPAFTTTV